MINCDTAKRMLSEYIENALLPEDKAAIDLHLQQCASCKHVFDDVVFLTSKLRQLPTVQTSEQFDSALRTRISNSMMLDDHALLSRKNITFGLSGAALIAAITFFILTTVNTPNGTLPNNNAAQGINQQQQMAAPIFANPALKTAAKGFSNIKDTVKHPPANVNQESIKLVDQERH